VVKVAWVARERRSCTSDYWQIAFLHLPVRKNAQERQAERYRNGCFILSNNSFSNERIWIISKSRRNFAAQENWEYGQLGCSRESLDEPLLASSAGIRPNRFYVLSAY